MQNAIKLVKNQNELDRFKHKPDFFGTLMVLFTYFTEPYIGKLKEESSQPKFFNYLINNWKIIFSPSLVKVSVRDQNYSMIFSLWRLSTRLEKIQKGSKRAIAPCFPLNKNVQSVRIEMSKSLNLTIVETHHAVHSWVTLNDLELWSVFSI